MSDAGPRCKSGLPRRGLAAALERMAASHGKSLDHDAFAAQRRAIYRDAQEPGSIAWIEAPGPGDAETAMVIMVAGGGRLLRVGLGRNRCANLIARLAEALAGDAAGDAA